MPHGMSGDRTWKTALNKWSDQPFHQPVLIQNPSVLPEHKTSETEGIDMDFLEV